MMIMTIGPTTYCQSIRAAATCRYLIMFYENNGKFIGATTYNDYALSRDLADNIIFNAQNPHAELGMLAV